MITEGICTNENSITNESSNRMETDQPNNEKQTFCSRIFDKSKNWKFTFFVVCLICFIENLIISGSATVVLSTLEKEFFLTSTQSGFFLGIYELAGFLAAPIFGFFASSKTANKIKIISSSLFLISFGALMIGLTIFIKEPYLDFFNNQIDNNSSSTCTFDESRSTSNSLFGVRSDDDVEMICDEDTEDTLRSYSGSLKLEYLLYFGHLIIGFGAVAIYNIGVAYIEEITPTGSSSYCQAIFYGIGSIGGGLGFLVTGQFLTINARFYMDSYEPNDWITPDHPYWIGAWWLPYVCYGSLTMVLFVLVYIFSYRSYDTSTKHVRTVTNESGEKPSNQKSNKFLKILSKFWSKFSQILMNVQFIFIILSFVTEGIIFKGFLGFLPKYIEYQFQMPANQSTVLLGFVAFISIILGTFLSAWLINRYKMNSKHCSIFTMILFIISAFLFIILLNYCPEYSLIENFNNTKCLDCDCTNKFNPVCFDKTLLNPNYSSKLYAFQSACHAGCHEQFDGEDTYYKCLCIDDDMVSVDNISAIILSSKNCDRSVKCLDKLLINSLAAFFIVFFTSLAIIPHLKASFGTISDEHLLPFALGVRAAIVCLFGNFLGTILFGKVVDNSCKYWQRNCLDSKVCKLYDNQSMSLSLAFVGFVCRLLSGIFMIFVCIIYHYHSNRPPLPEKNNSLKESNNGDVEMTSQITRF